MNRGPEHKIDQEKWDSEAFVVSESSQSTIMVFLVGLLNCRQPRSQRGLWFELNAASSVDFPTIMAMATQYI